MIDFKKTLFKANHWSPQGNRSYAGDKGWNDPETD